MLVHVCIERVHYLFLFFVIKMNTVYIYKYSIYTYISVIECLLQHASHMHREHASVCAKFACIVCDIIFVSSYSRPLTLRVCLEGDGERMERVQEGFE